MMRSRSAGLAVLVGGLLGGLAARSAAGAPPGAHAPAGQAKPLPEAVDAGLVPNYKLVREGVAAGGQPALDQLGRLKELGFRTLVNLRTTGEGAKAQEATVTQAGLGYVWIPVSAETLSKADARQIDEVLRDRRRGPVLVYCASGNRVGAAFALIEVLNGKSIEDAEAVGRAVGMRSATMIEAFRHAAALP
jgi:uncharacterized protein (TIGR01244 family)